MLRDARRHAPPSLGVRTSAAVKVKCTAASNSHVHDVWPVLQHMDAAAQGTPSSPGPNTVCPTSPASSSTPPASPHATPRPVLVSTAAGPSPVPGVSTACGRSHASSRTSSPAVSTRPPSPQTAHAALRLSSVLASSPGATSTSPRLPSTRPTLHTDAAVQAFATPSPSPSASPSASTRSHSPASPSIHTTHTTPASSVQPLHSTMSSSGSVGTFTPDGCRRPVARSLQLGGSPPLPSAAPTPPPPPTPVALVAAAAQPTAAAKAAAPLSPERAADAMEGMSSPQLEATPASRAALRRRAPRDAAVGEGADAVREEGADDASFEAVHAALAQIAYPGGSIAADRFLSTPPRASTSSRELPPEPVYAGPAVMTVGGAFQVFGLLEPVGRARTAEPSGAARSAVSLKDPIEAPVEF
jgi:hypothetical protein